MFDHLTLTVRDLPRSLAFYTRALAPLGYGVTMRFENFVGIGTPKKPFFWLKSGPVSPPRPCTWPSSPRREKRWTAFTRRRFLPALRMTGHRDSGRTTTPTTTAPSSSTWTGTPLKRCATARPSPGRRERREPRPRSAPASALPRSASSGASSAPRCGPRVAAAKPSSPRGRTRLLLFFARVAALKFPGWPRAPPAGARPRCALGTPSARASLRTRPTSALASSRPVPSR